MKSYQDLINVGENELEKGKFCMAAIKEFRASKEYADAVAGEAYYNRHNLTIEKYQKFIYTVSGNQVPDLISPNYKLKTTIFRRLLMQQNQYVLGNGVKLSDPANKEKLGKDFDFKLQTLGKRAMAAGRGFGFWNYDHLEVFGFADTPSQPGFCPLYSEETGELMAGIRFWSRKTGNKILQRFTLYEVEGITEYRKVGSKDIEVIESRRGYIRNTTYTEEGGVVDEYDENYTQLPIVPLYANDSHESELNGFRESIDCYDFIKSSMANDSDNSGFYWILKNSGGMDDVDLAQFVHRMRTVRAASMPDDDVEAEAHTLDIPIGYKQTMLEILRKDIYEDFQALDVNTLSAAAKTTQEIQAAYQSQDNKCADYEYYILDFVQKILALAGIDDNPTLTWNKVLNLNEQTNMVLSAANYLSDECIIKHLPFLTPEEADEEINRREDEMYGKFHAEELLEGTGTTEEVIVNG